VAESVAWLIIHVISLVLSKLASSSLLPIRRAVWRCTLLALAAGLSCSPLVAKPRKGAAPRPGDWEVLYSGKTHQLRGYKLYDFPRRSWKIERGELKTIAGGPKVDLISLELYEDFELEVEWRAGAGAESGILYRVIEDYGPSSDSGLEYQIAGEGEAGLAGTKRGTGALYELQAPQASTVSRAVGGYHLSVIRMSKGQIEHWLNGVQLMSVSLDSSEFQQALVGSPFRSLPRYGREKAGHVCLQHTGHEVSFRSIRVRRLGQQEISSR